MPYKIKPAKRRALWLNIRAKTSGQRVPRETVIETLIAAVERGDYRYPDDWYVQIEWRNRDNARDRVGEFQAEMHLSKRSSDGFDKAVLNYLRGKL